MVGSMRETERKYEVPSSEDISWLPELERLDGVTRVADSHSEELDAVYYDTEDLRLLGSSVTLRRRSGGSDAGWHLKLPLPGDSREEVRSAPTEDIPGALLDLTLSRTRGAELTPVVRMHTHREVWPLMDAEGPEGAPRAEVSVDAVDAESLRAEGGHTAWRELEVETAGEEEADRAVLDAVDEALRERGLARAQAPSKLARAVEETGAAPSGEPDRSAGPAGEPDRSAGPAGEQVLAYLRAQIESLTAYDPAARRDRPDAVHRMRVACRRLRSCLRSYRSVLDREVTDPVRGELKWLAGELAPERDQEVLMERLTHGIETLPRELLLGPVTARLRVWEVARHAENHQRTLDALHSRRYLALLDSLATLVEQPPLRAKAAGEADKVMVKGVLKEFDRLAEGMGVALSLPPGARRDVALHEARKSAKKVRYASEVARAAVGEPAKRLGKRAKAVQQLLGDHQDSVVARGTLRDLATAARTAHETGFTWGLLYGREEAVAEKREGELPTVWERASKPALRKRLRHARA
ncbi:CYTH and CHAD domain-containing protein [Streptomyces sp. NPDC006458]|uniref:CYTH and CHAD domain-containing protein n=1 Tax=Streptomyces sp. NPDC006458 TaxID=3154302 RepID=UPI0033B5498F